MNFHEILTIACQLTLMSLIAYQYWLLRKASRWLLESFAREKDMADQLIKTTDLLDQAILQIDFLRKLVKA